MDDLQSTLQSILSDPEQMGRISAMAESLGLKPPDSPPSGDGRMPPPADTGGSAQATPAQLDLGGMGLDLGKLMGTLGAMQGTEDRVLNALRPSLSQEGQGRVDRALRAAKLSRLAGQFLARRGGGHV